MLAVLPSVLSSSQISAKLVVVDLEHLEKAPFSSYEALSYTWGDPGLPRVPCKVNNQDYAITANLQSVLKQIRKRSNKRYVWVDALCINQDDLAERASQVQIMRRIYECAEQVIVWLVTRRTAVLMASA